MTVYKFFPTNSAAKRANTSTVGAVTRAYESAIRTDIILKQQLAEELNTPIIRKYEAKSLLIF